MLRKMYINTDGPTAHLGSPDSILSHPTIDIFTSTSLPEAPLVGPKSTPTLNMNNLTNIVGGQSHQPATQGQGVHKPDFLDKAFDTVSKKAGHDLNPSTDEKITDAGRGLFEKVTG
jgi:hypothetical protein